MEFKDMAMFLESFKAQPWIATKSGLPLPTRLFIQDYFAVGTRHIARDHTYFSFLIKENDKLKAFLYKI